MKPNRIIAASAAATLTVATVTFLSNKPAIASHEHTHDEPIDQGECYAEQLRPTDFALSVSAPAPDLGSLPYGCVKFRSGGPQGS